MGEQTLVLSNMGDRVESVFAILRSMIRKKKKKFSNIGEYNYVQKILMMQHLFLMLQQNIYVCARVCFLFFFCVCCMCVCVCACVYFVLRYVL